MKNAKILKNNINAIRDILRINKSRALVEMVRILISLLDLAIPIVLMKNILDSLSEKKEFEKFLFWLMAYILVSVFTMSINKMIDGIYYPKSNIEIEKYYKETIMTKMRHIDIEEYENATFLDKYSWIFKDISSRVLQVWSNIWLFVSTFISTIYLLFNTAIYSWLILLFALMQLVVTYFSNKRIDKIEYDYQKNIVIEERKREYVKRLLYLPQYAHEMRLFFEMHKRMILAYSEATDALKSKTKSYVKKTFVMRLASDSGSLFSFLGIILIALIALISKQYTVGDIYAIYLVILNFSSKVQQLILCYTGMQKHSMYIENYNDFLKYQPRIGENVCGLMPKECPNEIELCDVSFGYSSEQESNLVLKHINMHIKAGEKIAIVGHNGAGKSTLIKLILRLYLPNSGNIFLDGKNASEYNTNSYRKRFGTIFQNFQMYAFNVGENVIMDNLHGSKDEIEKIWDALEKSGLSEKIKLCPQKLETAVTKEFEEDGLVFSGGEAQKLAISRILARDCGVVIMDEPSSNLDPISEYELLNKILLAVEDKTVIIISHRLSTTIDVDRIYLMNDGEIVEQGTHQQLMELGGEYAKMFNAQASKYVDKVSG